MRVYVCTGAASQVHFHYDHLQIFFHAWLAPWFPSCEPKLVDTKFLVKTGVFDVHNFRIPPPRPPLESNSSLAQMYTPSTVDALGRVVPKVPYCFLKYDELSVQEVIPHSDQHGLLACYSPDNMWIGAIEMHTPGAKVSQHSGHTASANACLKSDFTSEAKKDTETAIGMDVLDEENVALLAAISLSKMNGDQTVNPTSLASSTKGAESIRNSINGVDRHNDNGHDSDEDKTLVTYGHEDFSFNGDIGHAISDQSNSTSIIGESAVNNNNHGTINIYTKSTNNNHHNNQPAIYTENISSFWSFASFNDAHNMHKICPQECNSSQRSVLTYHLFVTNPALARTVNLASARSQSWPELMSCLPTCVLNHIPQDLKTYISLFSNVFRQ
jgi:hypothetical protein